MLIPSLEVNKSILSVVQLTLHVIYDVISIAQSVFEIQDGRKVLCIVSKFRDFPSRSVLF